MCPDWLTAIPIAHRGLHDGARGVPENSLVAFAAAVAEGFPVELDVRVLADGAVVVFHDRDLARMTGAPGDVARIDRAAVAGLRLAGTPEPVPLLADALGVIAGRVPVLVEIKNEGVTGRIETAVLGELAQYAGPLAVQSFNPLTMAWFRERAPRLPRGLLSGDFRDVRMAALIRRRLQRMDMFALAAPDFVGYDVRCLPYEPVTRVRDRGVPVLGWTIRSAAAERAARAQCDNVIFEGYRPAGGRYGPEPRGRASGMMNGEPA